VKEREIQRDEERERERERWKGVVREVEREKWGGFCFVRMGDKHDVATHSLTNTMLQHTR